MGTLAWHGWEVYFRHGRGAVLRISYRFMALQALSDYDSFKSTSLGSRGGHELLVGWFGMVPLLAEQLICDSAPYPFHGAPIQQQHPALPSLGTAAELTESLISCLVRNYGESAVRAHLYLEIAHWLKSNSDLQLLDFYSRSIESVEHMEVLCLTKRLLIQLAYSSCGL